MKNGLENAVPGINVLLNPDKVCLLMLVSLLAVSVVQPFVLMVKICIIKFSTM